MKYIVKSKTVFSIVAEKSNYDRTTVMEDIYSEHEALKIATKLQDAFEKGQATKEMPSTD